MKSRNHWTSHPREDANRLSLITLTWIAKIFWSNFMQKITFEDIWKPYSKHRSARVGEKLEREWNKQIKSENPSFLAAIFRAFSCEIFILASFQLFQQLNDVLVTPWMLKSMLSYFKVDRESDLKTASYSAVGLLLSILVSYILRNHYVLNSCELGMKVRAACISLVYRKCLKISKGALSKISTGQVVNLVSNDVSRFDLVAITMNYLWSAPMLTIISCYILYNEVKFSGIAGLFVILTVSLLQSFAAKLTAKFRKDVAEKTDERIRLTNEVITGIRVIKTYAWEKAFANILDCARKRELDPVYKANLMRAAYMTFSIFTNRMAVFSTILSYVLLGDTLNAQTVAVVTLYYEIISSTFCGLFVKGLSDVAECLVSIKRIQSLLLREEVDAKGKDNEGFDVEDGLIHQNVGIELRNVDASWEEDSLVILKDLNLNIKRKQVAAVIGSVGSGKSSLLELILGEMKIRRGTVNVNGNVSYSSQESWMFKGTIRENILFGLPYIRKRYDEVARACSLVRDFNLLPNGDKTEIDERGDSLSGGQKARINLARAVYKEADIYIFDDPFSALDAHVSKNLLNDCFKNFLKGKMVIVATHQLQIVDGCDRIIFLKEGRIHSQGSFSEIVLENHEIEENLSIYEETKNEDDEYIQKRRYSRLMSITSLASTNFDEIMWTVDDHGAVVEKTQKSTKRENDYKGNIFFGFIKSGPAFLSFIFFIFLHIGSHVLASSCDFYVSYWTTQDEIRVSMKETCVTPDGKMTETRAQSALFYGLMVLFLFVFAFSRGFVFSYMCKKCSKGLHTEMTNSMLDTDIGFFHKNPTGEVLNRFSKDLGLTDEFLPKAILDAAHVFGLMFGAVVLTMIVDFWFSIPLFIFMAVSVTIRHYFLKISNNVKQIENIARGPVFSHLSTTLQGLSTIRAHESQEYLLKQFDFHQDLHSSVMYTFVATQQAFSYCLDILGVLYLSSIVVSFLLFKNDAYGANVGLIITQTIMITTFLQWGMRQSAVVSNSMTSIERLLLLGSLPEEEKNEKKPMNSLWPTEGDIKCFDLVVKYNSQDDPILSIEKLHINPGEKIGIVGRTGAGKSSFTSALFRMAHIEGQILIDDVDTSNIPLNYLRSNISIIPQNPVLFSGSLRMNLDPYNKHPDYVLWRALNEVDLHDVIKGGFGLDTKITDGGSNLSLGQRQLVCLARAIVKNSKIIILDEATASMDQQTDKVIQKTIAKIFKNCTVLAIAHRLNTVIDSDRILVLDAGKVVEFDTPVRLLERKDGVFFYLVHESGMASQLIYQAQQPEKVMISTSSSRFDARKRSDEASFLTFSKLPLVELHIDFYQSELKKSHITLEE